MLRLFSIMLLSTATLAESPAITSFIPETAPKPWTHLNIKDDGEKFQFAIVTDRTGGMRPGVFEEAAQKLNLLQPCFVMSVGDLIEGGGGADRAELLRQWEEFDGIVDQLEMPFFYVPGNHDVTNSKDGRSLWQERVGPLFYHFLYKNTLFIAMNSDDSGVQQLGDEQIEYVKKALADHPDVRWTFLFYHKPIFTVENSRWSEIEELLQHRPHTVFSGHRHDYMKYERHTRDYFVLGTTGGGMAHEGLQMGDLDHVVWVTVDEGEPDIANLLLNGIQPKDFRTDWAAAYSLPLLRGQATPEAQVWVEDKNAQQLMAQVPLRNPLDVPLRIVGRIRPTDHLRAEPQRFEVELAPKGEQKVQVALTALADIQPEQLQAMPIEYAFIVQPPDRDPLMFSSNSRLYFDSANSLPKLRGEVALDGDLNELEALAFRCIEPLPALRNSEEWRTAADASFEFGAARTDDALYVCVRVIDDHRQVARGWRAWKQDGLEIRLDARPEAEAPAVETAQDRDQSQYLYVALNPHEEEPRVFEADKLPQGVQFVCRPTPEGFVAEGLIPLTLIETRQGGKWDSFRLNLTLYDYDQLSDSGSILHWRPEWNQADAAASAGRFYRSGR